MLPDNFETYRKNNIYSAGKIKSLVLLIDRALTECRLALADLSRNQSKRARIQEITVQLRNALNLENGEVPRNLYFLYDFIYECVKENTRESINKAIVILKRIREMMEFLARKQP